MRAYRDTHRKKNRFWESAKARARRETGRDTRSKFQISTQDIILKRKGKTHLPWKIQSNATFKFNASTRMWVTRGTRK